jgi:hypothetical protein
MSNAPQTDCLNPSADQHVAREPRTQESSLFSRS